MSGFNRGTGLLIIEARLSNPNGDPDAESEPRTLTGDGRGLISPVSFKRKIRDMLIDESSAVRQSAISTLRLSANGDGRKYGILESRGRDRNEISKMQADQFRNAYWDGRVFGNTFLESMKDGAAKGRTIDHFITTGVVQLGPGVSIAPIETERMTMTNKSGVEEGKDRGMAPLAWRAVRHAIYAMPYFVNPTAAGKSGCSKEDIDLLKFLVPHAYRNAASAVRPFVEIVHAWYAEHKSPLGSCQDSHIIDALTPRKVKGNPEEASRSRDEYEIPTALPESIRGRLEPLEDLCTKQWG